jgi:hypothetical protein
MQQSKTLLILVLVIVLSIAGFILVNRQIKNTKTNPLLKIIDENGNVTGPLTIPLNNQNESGENGTATLSEENGKLKVSITISGAPAGLPQPAHIHKGECLDPSDVVYPLTTVLNGKSETQLDISLRTLLSQLPLVVNVHKSPAEATVYVACGNITLQ